MPEGQRIMSDEEFLNEMRLRVLEAATETNRLLRIDAEITESLRDMIATARDEINRHPRLFFTTPTASPTPPSNTISEETIEGGQISYISGGQIPGLGDAILGLVREEKDLIKQIIRKLFGLP
jgi:hypothetical protein